MSGVAETRWVSAIHTPFKESESRLYKPHTRSLQ
jgi:hypothetical protein